MCSNCSGNYEEPEELHYFCGYDDAEALQCGCGMTFPTHHEFQKHLEEQE